MVVLRVLVVVAEAETQLPSILLITGGRGTLTSQFILTA